MNAPKSGKSSTKVPLTTEQTSAWPRELRYTTREITIVPHSAIQMRPISYCGLRLSHPDESSFLPNTNKQDKPSRLLRDASLHVATSENQTTAQPRRLPARHFEMRSRMDEHQSRIAEQTTDLTSQQGDRQHAAKYPRMPSDGHATSYRNCIFQLNGVNTLHRPEN